MTTKTLSKSDLAQFRAARIGIATGSTATFLTLTAHNMLPSMVERIGFSTRLRSFSLTTSGRGRGISSLETRRAARPIRYAHVDDGNGKIVFTKEIEHTDFPLDEITLYFANNVIHLPSEY